MATKIKKTITKKPLGELNRGQGVGGVSTGGGAGRADVKKKQNREQNKNIARAALRVGTMGYDAMVSSAIKKAKAKKATKK